VKKLMLWLRGPFDRARHRKWCRYHETVKMIAVVEARQAGHDPFEVVADSRWPHNEYPIWHSYAAQATRAAVVAGIVPVVDARVYATLLTRAWT